MKNALAYLFVCVFLAGCAAYTWEHTDTTSLLVNDYGGDQWRDQVRRGF